MLLLQGRINPGIIALKGCWFNSRSWTIGRATLSPNPIKAIQAVNVTVRFWAAGPQLPVSIPSSTISNKPPKLRIHGIFLHSELFTKLKPPDDIFHMGIHAAKYIYFFINYGNKLKLLCFSPERNSGLESLLSCSISTRTRGFVFWYEKTSQKTWLKEKMLSEWANLQGKTLRSLPSATTWLLNCQSPLPTQASAWENSSIGRTLIFPVLFLGRSWHRPKKQPWVLSDLYNVTPACGQNWETFPEPGPFWYSKYTSQRHILQGTSLIIPSTL